MESLALQAGDDITIEEMDVCAEDIVAIQSLGPEISEVYASADNTGVQLVGEFFQDAAEVLEHFNLAGCEDREGFIDVHGGEEILTIRRIFLREVRATGHGGNNTRIKLMHPSGNGAAFFIECHLSPEEFEAVKVAVAASTARPKHKATRGKKPEAALSG